MNLVASLALALLGVSGLMASVGPTGATVTLSVGLWFAGLWIGVRAALSCVLVSSDAVRYRGIFRSWTVRTDQVFGLVDGGAGPLAVLTNRNGPSLVWRDDTGESRRITLACLPSARRSAIGADSTTEVADDLRLVLEPYFRRNL
jgi:hypothetical protein